MNHRRPLLLTLLFAGCGPRTAESTPSHVGTATAPASEATAAPTTAIASASTPPSADEAHAFLGRVNGELRKLWIARDRAGWVSQNFITDDTEILAADAEAATAAYVSRTVREASRFAG